MRTLLTAATLLAVVVSCPVVGTAATTVAAEYPYMCSGALRYAQLADLANGVIAQCEGITVTGNDLNAQVEKAGGSDLEQVRKYPVYALEQYLTKRVMLIEAKDWAKKNGNKKIADDQLVESYLAAQTPKFEVSDKEAEGFYKEHVSMFSGLPYDQVKDAVISFVRDERITAAHDQLAGSAGKRHKILISASWIQTEHERWAKNPVEQARLSGKPTYVNFGVIGCCDTMNPVTQALRSDYGGKLNVVFVHVGEQEILSNLYGISTIPVQFLFDKDGKLLLRHQGFISEDQVIATFSKNGVGLSKGN